MQPLITDSAELAAICAELAQAQFITVDTEFIREKTYYPKLCLVQIAGPNGEYAIDPLAKGMNLKPLYELLANPQVLKVFHAAQQDIEIFLRQMGSIPAPLYDTQVAAMVCGFGESVGYESLVNTLLNETLDKASRYTDWEQRPLTPRQLNYAIADVTHLRQIYEQLSAKIEAKGRAEWIHEEMQRMLNHSQYQVKPEEAWQRLKYKNRSPKYLNVLRAIAEWRERMAQHKNIPRGRLLKDEVILQIAAMNPKNVEELTQVRGAMRSLNADNAESLIAALDQARDVGSDTFPRDEKRKRQLTAQQEGVVDVLRLLLRLQCDTHQVAPKLVASKEDLAELVMGDDTALLHGWRYDVFGHLAHDFLQGKLVLRVGIDGIICFSKEGGLNGH